MKLEDNINRQVYTYPGMYKQNDRSHTRFNVLFDMLIRPITDFKWTSDGYLYNEELGGPEVINAPSYGKPKFYIHIDRNWIEEDQSKYVYHKCDFDVSLSAKSNIFSFPDNIQPDYLEAVFEVAMRGSNSAKDPKKVQMLNDVITRYFYLKNKQGPIKVFLDDERPMPDEFTLQVYDADHAIDIVSFGNVEMISLDNDLGSYSEKEGYHVTNFIEEMVFQGAIRPPIINIHSANTVAQKEMERAIANANKYYSQ